ncbi:Deazaflavin-dependent nitroreductase [Baekduia alba]|uniref:nitroreductase family deazaflavin-dependent oxidoreductase n=1 Tax=Baekduia alba TaxID=2997333 RepID=UPI002340BDF1|nr:nitroreductase family deazaflavin-dependent oxidoreductase [Baekduia alba]WCB91559.1 Deazaflavin-dependent nitroreductase [Baekduia alba]
MSSKPPPAFPPPGTLKAKLANLIPKANIIIYRVSNGRFGGSMEDLPVLILHTVGRKSGKPRQSPLLYLQDDEDYVVVASRGGSDAPPAWWLNLQATPEATVEIKGTKRPVSARRATSEERAGYWPQLTAGYRFYDDYQARTDRDIPVLVLSNRGKP